MRLFSLILGLFLCTTNAYAGSCAKHTCPKGVSIGVGTEYIKTSQHGSLCYSCDTEDEGFDGIECHYGQVIGQTNADGEIMALLQCVDQSGPDDTWEYFDTGVLCSNSPVRNIKQTSNVHRVWHTDNNQDATTTFADGIKIQAGGYAACLYIECNDDSDLSADKKSCVKKNTNCKDTNGTSYTTNYSNTNALCQTTGGKVVDGLTSLSHVTGKCTMTCMANGWKIRLNSGACGDKYIVADDAKSCVEDPAAVQQRQTERRERVRRENASKQEKCEDSWGTWNGSKCTCDSAKNLKLSNGECTCINDADYTRDETNRRCNLTNTAALKQKCEAAVSSGASWDDGAKQCKCSGQYRQFNGTTCEDDPDMVACKKVSGAKWTGKCECTTDGYVVNEAGTQCVKSDALIKTEGQATSRTKISSLYKKLNGMSNDFQVSVWKNAEGNFNTARLASDSIAAVVLGTTGALVTSNVVKKNQVSSGFEDINCQIGGQTVAGWGDEFSVGMQ